MQALIKHPFYNDPRFVADEEQRKPGEVIQYKLTSEELEKYRTMKVRNEEKEKPAFVRFGWNARNNSAFSRQ